MEINKTRILGVQETLMYIKYVVWHSSEKHCKNGVGITIIAYNSISSIKAEVRGTIGILYFFTY